ncbi:MAG TPA: hypothetical protein VM553_12965 [Dongiaceae bacterium]|nr:hypothetical protein [Dongiaceae bacterium]
MIKLIQTHMMKKRVQARAAQPKETVHVSKDDIQRKLADYQPGTQRANFLGPKIDKKEFENA